MNQDQQSLGLAIEAVEQQAIELPEPTPLLGRKLTRHITDALCGHYSLRVEKGLCVVYRELPNTTGFNIRRFIDLYVQFLYTMNTYQRIAYEVKISRSDFLSELREPKKREFALSVSNQFFFATPPGLVRPGELPAECGLMEIVNGRVITKKRAPQRQIERPSWDFVASMVRAASKAAPVAADAAEGPTE